MDNKDYLEHTYKTNYDSAVKFVQYNNLPERIGPIGKRS